MKRLALIAALGLAAGCGAEGDPLRPTAGLGINIGPGGVSLNPNLRVSDGNSSVNIGAGGVRAGTQAGPVSLGAAL